MTHAEVETKALNGDEVLDLYDLDRARLDSMTGLEEGCTRPPGEARVTDLPGIEEEGQEGGEAGEGIPDGGYGWVVVGCMVAMNACTWGEWCFSTSSVRLIDADALLCSTACMGPVSRALKSRADA
jgi:hypothetical protein